MILQFCTFAGGNEDEINLSGLLRIYEKVGEPDNFQCGKGRKKVVNVRSFRVYEVEGEVCRTAQAHRKYVDYKTTQQKH